MKATASQRGAILLEMVIGIALMGIVVTTILVGFSVGVRGAQQLEEGNRATALARSQVEYVKQQPYSEPPTYPLLTPPEGYQVQVSGEVVVSSFLQRVTVQVLRGGSDAFTLETYKANRVPGVAPAAGVTATPTPIATPTPTPTPTPPPLLTPTPTATPTPTPLPAPVLVIVTPNSDAYVYNSDPNTNYGSLYNLAVQSRSADRTMRTLVLFDLSSIPAGSTVLSATLRMYQFYVQAGDRRYEVWRANQVWSEATVTWSNQPNTLSSPTAWTLTNDSPGWMEWNVTADVSAWVSGSAMNYGLKVVDWTESSSPLRRSDFYSKEYADSSLWPQLVIRYQPPG